MGTNVQCKSYIRDCYPTRDLNEDASNSWSSYYEDKAPNCHLYGGFFMRQVDEHSEHEMEILKRIMLEHEATFRKQVYELHRLYRIQKDLMDDFKKEYHKHSSSTGASESNSALSQVPFESPETRWNSHHTSALDGCTYGSATAGHIGTNYPLNLLRENGAKFTTLPRDNGGSPQDRRSMDARLKVSSKITFDLELPGDMYLDSEDVEGNEGDEMVDLNDLNEDVSHVDVCSKSGTILQSHAHVQSITDLNEPTQGASYEGFSIPPSSCLFDSKRKIEEVQDHASMKLTTTTTGCYRDFYQHMHRGKETCADTLYAEEKKANQQRLLFECEAGPSRSGWSQDLQAAIYPISYEAIESKLRRAQEILLPEQSNTETWFTTSTRVHDSLSAVSNMDFAKSVPSLGKSVNGISRVPATVQALPCFGGSTLKSRNFDTASQTAGQASEWKYNQETGFVPRHGTDASYLTRFHRPIHAISKLNLDVNHYDAAHKNSESEGLVNYFRGSQTMDMSSVKDADSNKVLLNGIHDGFFGQSYRSVHDGEWKPNQGSERFSWLNMKPARNQFAEVEKDCSQTIFISAKCSLQPAREEIDLNITLDSLTEDIDSAQICSPSCKIKFDLNDLAEVPHDDMVNDQGRTSGPSGSAKRPFIIDLEVPADQIEEDMFTVGNHSIKTDGPEESECSSEALVRVAAKNIIVLSKDMSSCSNTCSLPSLPLSYPDSLHWFADVALSGKPAEGLVGCSEDEHSDSFENSTLKLEETKTDNYYVLPKEQESSKDDGKSAASLLTKPRRGQARRRRQRRDFQKDILPGLITLSRNEVTEDLQAFGGIMKASGRAWHVGQARRNTTRKCRAAATPIVETCDEAPKVVNNVQLDKAEGTGIVGWGRTRRCRRQRFPPGNVATPLI